MNATEKEVLAAMAHQLIVAMSMMATGLRSLSKEALDASPVEMSDALGELADYADKIVAEISE